MVSSFVFFSDYFRNFLIKLHLTELCGIFAIISKLDQGERGGGGLPCDFVFSLTIPHLGINNDYWPPSCSRVGANVSFDGLSGERYIDKLSKNGKTQMGRKWICIYFDSLIAIVVSGPLQ